MSSNKKTLIDGDFQVGSSHLVVDTENNYVGFNNATPQNKIDVQIGTRTGTHSTDKPLYVTGVTSTSGAEFVSDDGTAGIGIGSSNIFATETNQNITIAPDGTGAVGIKTATPNPSGETFDLWVQGDTKITGNVTVNEIYGDGSGLFNVAGTQWVSSSEDIYFLNNTGSGEGKVGIGKTVPEYKLDILDSDKPTIRVKSTSTGDGDALLILDSSATGESDIDFNHDGVLNWRIRTGDAAPSGLSFQINNANDSDVLTIQQNGNVGIGTDSPNVPLEVNKSAGGEMLRLATSTGTIYAGVDANPPWFGTSSDDHLRLVTNGTEKVRIESGGNIGIGKTDPGTALDVNGTVTATTFTGALSNNLSPGSYLTGNAYNGSTARTFSVDATTTNTASKIVARNSNGDIFGRYMNMSHSTGTRNSDTVFYSSTDNYIRKTTASGMRSSLNVPTRTGGDASGTWDISISGNASSATNVKVDRDDTGDTSMYLTMVNNNTAENSKRLYMDTNLVYDNTNNELKLTSMQIADYIYHADDTNTYFGFDAADHFRIVEGGGTRFQVDSNGRIGIETTSPNGKLHIYEPTGTSHGVGVGTLILDHGNSGGSSSIVFPSRVNITSDYGYITYNENYGEAGVSSSENGVLLLGAENDGTGSSDHVRVKTRLVVEADMTTTDPTYAFQVKSSNTTSDLFAVHRDGSIGINGVNLNVPFNIQTNKTIAVNGTSYNSYCRWYRGSGNWYIGSDNATDWNQNLYWFANINATGNPLRKVIMFENDQSKGTNVNANTFTGQHRNIVKGVNPTNIESFIGLIVSADNNENIKVNGGVERGLEAITINETIPLVSVTTKAYDKQVFGVVSGSEDPDSRQDTYGRVTCSFLKEEGDDRIFINSLGEGAMWISNQNGPLESGDYVTSSHIPGYGMKQDSEFLANYTVAKITMDCDFQVTPRVKYRIKTELKTLNYFRHEESFLKESDYNKLEPDTQLNYSLEQYEENVNILDEHGQLQWEDSGESEAPYQVRYLLPDGTQISEEEYTTRALADEKVYIAAFVGCTYHCG
jgi:hypothetical protein